ncbi:cell division protein ZipA [Shewanella saliphila]|uniref:Cell division protein ZipA n=1 Tax=Shewanella saliphila TaxID=2282698 RepID=A0ABQ2Q7W7_9GAMM|nr:cell division protein ZipA [Shewanella saliphila]MCL1102263.1 cell division protein ZipA [Shewanella saliphila]GGP54735.1 cell division protein ZipA [Shewanella saliphila]
MKDLQLVLFILGAIAIIAVLVHGFWSIRKQQPKSMKQSPMAGFYKNQAQRRDSEGFDADGIGQVRVRKADEVEETVIKPVLKTNLSQKPTEPKLSDTPLQDAFEQTPAKAQQPTQQPLFADDDQVSEAASSHASLSTPKKIVNPSTSTAKLESYTGKPLPTKPAPAKTESTKTEPAKIEPLILDEAPQAVEAEPQVQPSVSAEVKAEPAPQIDEPIEPTDVLVLHVVAKPGEQINGAELLPSLLSLNFKFGDMDIFHRHIDNAGTGKVLFSLANMLKPGVFDPDNMEQFVTQGVVMFMTLPAYGDPMMNFTIMLNSAYQIADDLGAELLDGQRQPWSEATKKDYIRRVNAA